MNIFKKDIKISFINKVKSRMIEDIKKKFSRYRISCSIPLYLSAAWFFLSILTYFFSFFIKLQFISDISFISLAVSGLCFITLFPHWTHIDFIKQIEKKINHNEIEYRWFSQEKDFETINPSIFCLNKEEVQELLVLNLTSDQLRDLNEIIQQQGYIHFKHLEQLSHVITQEELDRQKQMKLIEENKQAQHNLDHFLSVHEVNDYFNVQLLQEKLKKDEILLTAPQSITISSKL